MHVCISQILLETTELYTQTHDFYLINSEFY